MIRYALRCDKGHAFESWFQSSAAYDSQRRRKLVTCPVCDSAAVEKAIMAPRLAATARKQAPAPAAAPAAEPVALISPQEQALRGMLKEMRDYIVSKADNVGERFPDEARRIHYGDAEARPIYGEASLDDAKALIEEGIEVAPLPIVPDDRN
jgi:hypothetical protein